MFVPPRSLHFDKMKLQINQCSILVQFVHVWLYNDLINPAFKISLLELVLALMCKKSVLALMIYALSALPCTTFLSAYFCFVTLFLSKGQDKIPKAVVWGQVASDHV